MNKVKGVYKRSDGRWEARYKRGLDENGKTLYSAVYGESEEEVIRRRAEITGCYEDTHARDHKLNLLILGAGSHGRNVKEVAESLRIFNRICFLDDKATGPDIIGKCKDAANLQGNFPCACIAIGDNKIRKKWAKFLKERNFFMPNIIAASADISSKAVLGEGIVALPHCTIGESEIGDFCILASNSLVSIDSKLGAYSHVDEGAVCPKRSKVPEGTWVKTGQIWRKE